MECILSFENVENLKKKNPVQIERVSWSMKL